MPGHQSLIYWESLDGTDMLAGPDHAASRRFLDHAGKFLADALTIPMVPANGTLDCVIEAERYLVAATAALRTCHELYAGGGEALDRAPAQLQPMLCYIRTTRNWLLHAGPMPCLAPTTAGKWELDWKANRGAVIAWHKLQMTVHEIEDPDETNESIKTRVDLADKFAFRHNYWWYECVAGAAYETSRWIDHKVEMFAALAGTELDAVLLRNEVADLAKFRSDIQGAVGRGTVRASELKAARGRGARRGKKES